MTKAEQLKFNTFVEKTEWLKALIYLRHVWKKHANMHFLKKFTLVHWGRPEKMNKLLNEAKPGIEICCQAYLKPPYKCGWVGGIGAIIKGDITLAGSSDLQSKQWMAFTKKYDKIFTDYPSRLLVDSRDFRGAFEFIVVNWETTGLIIDEQFRVKWSDGTEGELFKQILEYATEHRLSIVDIEGRKIFS
ncbi:MAG: hypothetical protein ABIC95_06545 [archaeon]